VLVDGSAIDEAAARLERDARPVDEEPFELELPDAPSDDEHTRRGALIAAREIELMERRRQVASVRRLDHVDLLPPGTVNPDSGRPQLTPEPPLMLVGRYLWRARMLAGKTQQQVADETGVSQSMVSRAERAVAPGMPLDRFVAMCLALDRLFPFGVCPHDHECSWQPIRREHIGRADASQFIAYLMRIAGES